MQHQILINIIIFVAYVLKLLLNTQRSHSRSQRAGKWSLILAHDRRPIYRAPTYIAVPLLGPHRPRYIGLTLYNSISTFGLTPKITAKWHPRRGRECVIPTVKKTAPPDIKKLFYASLPVHGQQLFNTLPTDIRSITRCSVDCFKRKLDKYLWTVPNEPQIPGYTAQRRADSNSLVDMSRYASAHHQPVVEVPGDSLTPGNRGCANSIAMAQ